MMPGVDVLGTRQCSGICDETNRCRGRRGVDPEYEHDATLGVGHKLGDSRCSPSRTHATQVCHACVTQRLQRDVQATVTQMLDPPLTPLHDGDAVLDGQVQIVDVVDDELQVV